MGGRTVEVVFSILYEGDPLCPMFMNEMLPFSQWAEIPHNAETVVNMLCRDCISEDVWKEWWGLEEQTARVAVVITQPAWLAGTYEVVITRGLTFKSQKVAQPLGEKE